MGKAHALAVRNARAVIGPAVPEIRLEMLCDTPADKAAGFADQFGFARATDDWRALVADPARRCGLDHHAERAAPRNRAGRDCGRQARLVRKADGADAGTMRARWRRRRGRPGVAPRSATTTSRTRPSTHARRLIADGPDRPDGASPRLGRRGLSGRSRPALDLAGDPGRGRAGRAGRSRLPSGVDGAGPRRPDRQPDRRYPGRSTRPGRSPMAAAARRSRTRIPRPRSCASASGAQGSISASRSAWGRKNRLDWEVHGTRGMIAFAQERMNELAALCPRRAGGRGRVQDHPDRPGASALWRFRAPPQATSSASTI